MMLRTLQRNEGKDKCRGRAPETGVTPEQKFPPAPQSSASAAVHSHQASWSPGARRGGKEAGLWRAPSWPAHAGRRALSADLQLQGGICHCRHPDSEPRPPQARASEEGRVKGLWAAGRQPLCSAGKAGDHAPPSGQSRSHSPGGARQQRAPQLRQWGAGRGAGAPSGPAPCLPTGHARG